MKYIKVITTYGLRYFPKTDDDQFNKWNSRGYINYHKMFKGYQVYLKWIEKLDKETLIQMENDNVI